MYDGPDGHNPCFDVREGEVDVWAVVSNRRRLDEEATSSRLTSLSPRQMSDIVPGSGWRITDEKPGMCDGGYHSICGREKEENCPALANQNSHGTFVGNEETDWLVFDIPDVKEGLILLRYEALEPPTGNRRNLDKLDGHPLSRSLDLPDAFAFEFAINGEVTSWSKDEFLEKTGKPQRLVQVVTLLDDASFDGGPALEVAVRVKGCPANSCAIKVPHIYWA